MFANLCLRQMQSLSNRLADYSCSGRRFLNELPVQSKVVAQRMLHARLQLLVILHDHQETYATASCKEVVVFTLPRGYMRNWDCCRGPYITVPVSHVATWQN